jgi:arabinofuranosyltransferase
MSINRIFRRAYDGRFPAVSSGIPVSSRWVLILLLVGSLILAWHNRFIQDDAFISFRYAQHLVQGKGLVWNAGDKVEGYTNFLWTLLMAVPHYFGIDPVVFSMTIGMVFFLMCLCVTYSTAINLFGSQSIALVSVLFLGSNYTFSSFATGGMETEMQAGLLAASLLVFVRSVREDSWKGKQLILLSFLTALSLLTRMDSLVIALPLFLLAAIFSLGAARTWKEGITGICALVIPVATIVGLWLAWKLFYYGDILPNTYYIKIASETSAERGAAYVLDFFLSYWLAPFVVLFVILIFHSVTISHKEDRDVVHRSVNNSTESQERSSEQREGIVLGPHRTDPADSLTSSERRAIALIALLAILWFVYVIGIGGDFMEFRMMVPALPFLALIIGWVTIRVTHYRIIRFGLVLVMLCGSVHHAVKFEWDGRYGPESIRQLKVHLAENGHNWIGIGRTLRRELDMNPAVTIGTGNSGAIPYYSGLRTVDLFGLNDREIAKEGAPWTHVPGHQRRAFLYDLVRRKVNLIIGGMNHRSTHTEAAIILTFKDMMKWPVAIGHPQDIPVDSCVIEIPVADGRTFSAWYLVKSQFIDELIRERKWKTHPIDPRRL